MAEIDCSHFLSQSKRIRFNSPTAPMFGIRQRTHSFQLHVHSTHLSDTSFWFF